MHRLPVPKEGFGDSRRPPCSQMDDARFDSSGCPLTRRTRSNSGQTDRPKFRMQGLPKLDRYDLNILAALQAKGRMTYQELGDLVGLSASPCLQRVKKLESAGYIAGYGAWVELHKLLNLTTVFSSVTLRSHTQADLLRFETGLRKYSELIECNLVIGGFDYLLKFVTHSIADYHAIMEEVTQLGVEKYFSHVVIKTPISQRFTPMSLAGSHSDEFS